MGASPGADALQRLKLGMGILPHPAHIPVHNGGEHRELRFKLQRLINLLLVLAKDDDGFGVLQHILHLGCSKIWVKAYDLGTDAKSRVFAPEQLRLVLTYDGDGFTLFDVQRCQTHRDVAHAFHHIVPGVSLPDAKILAPVQNAILVTGSKSCGMVCTPAAKNSSYCAQTRASWAGTVTRAPPRGRP